MLKAFFFSAFIISVFSLTWQVLLFMWVGLNASGEWLHDVVHPVLKANELIPQMVLFVGSLLFSPFPWWTAFFFLLIPMTVAMSLLVLFLIMFMLSFAQSIVFI